MLADIESRFSGNLSRVENLVGLYENAGGKGSGRRPVHSTDVLRAATVLLHATLEDLTRSIVAWRWPTDADGELLDQIPLIGSGHEQPRKFLLGALAPYREATVQDVITQSIHEHLTRSNYNRPEHVVRALISVGVQAGDLTCDMEQLGTMMSRRHWIVHRADLNPQTGAGQHKTQSINPATVRGWAQNVRTLGEEVIAQLEAL